MAFDAWGHSWGGPFTRFVMWGAAEQASPKQYGPPFADFSLDLTTTVDRFMKMKRDVHARMRSNRVDVDGESEP